MTGKHPLGNWSTNPKGYPKFHSGAYRKQFVHRVVFRLVAERPIREGFHIHHQNGKLCFCPHQLVEIDPLLNPSPEPLRHPYTGQFMSREEFNRVMGI